MCLKKIFRRNYYLFLKSSHFCAILSIFWRLYLQTRLIYNFRFPVHNKFMISTSLKFLIRSFILDQWSVQTNNTVQYLVYPRSFKCSRWQQHKGILPINTPVIVFFWYFDNNMISVISLLAFIGKFMFPQFKFPHYTTSVHHIFFLVKA